MINASSIGRMACLHAVNLWLRLKWCPTVVFIIVITKKCQQYRANILSNNKLQFTIGSKYKLTGKWTLGAQVQSSIECRPYGLLLLAFTCVQRGGQGHFRKVCLPVLEFSWYILVWSKIGQSDWNGTILKLGQKYVVYMLLYTFLKVKR